MLEFSMFERLPIRSQAEMLAKEGTVIAQRQYNDLTVTLYTLHNRFVELWSGKDAEVISTFKTNVNAFAILEPYAEGIDVLGLIES